MSTVIWIVVLAAIVVAVVLPMVLRRRRDRRRRRLIQAFEAERGSRVITMIHRQESMALLGIPFGRFIDIEDSEQLLRAIRLTPEDMPIDLVLHTPGGLVLASDQIAHALKRHPGKVTVFVPHYAMSGGTLIALAADEIVMDADAVLGPVDPQLGSPLRGAWPAASILAALEHENPNRSDETLILGDISAQGHRAGARHGRRAAGGPRRRRRPSGSRRCSARAAGHTTTPSVWTRRASSACR